MFPTPFPISLILLGFSVSMAVRSFLSLPSFPYPSRNCHFLTTACFSSIRFPPRTITTSHLRCHLTTATPSRETVGEDLPVDYADWLPKSDSRDRRRAGVLLHPTSFPGPYGIGDLGDQAFRFIDWLYDAGCSLWQVLPLVPPGRKANEEGSPYSGQDANCGNTLLISLDDLVKDGLLTKEELPEPLDEDRVNYATVADIKDPLIAKAAKRLISSEGNLKCQLEDFCKDPGVSEYTPYLCYDGNGWPLFRDSQGKCYIVD